MPHKCFGVLDLLDFHTGQKVSRGINDLQTVNPLLAEYWNYAKTTI